jgi:hypothetical protein
MAWQRSKVVQLGVGLASLSVVILLAWGAIWSAALRSDSIVEVIYIMGGLTVVIIIAFLIAMFRAIKT